MGSNSGNDTTVIHRGTHHPFTWEMASELGLSQWQVRNGPYRRIMHGVYVHEAIPDSLPVRARAAQLVAPPWGVLSHETAASLWCPRARRSADIHGTSSGAPVSYQTSSLPCLRPEIRIHRFVYPLERTPRQGLLVTPPGMTFMHLAVHWDLVELTAFGDMLVKRSHISLAELQSYAQAWPHHGAERGRAAAQLVRERVDSSPETHLCLLLVLAGLPEPVVNLEVPGAEPGKHYRLDLAYPALKIAVEYDGRWHDTEEQRAKDEARRTILRSRGWIVIVVTAPGLYENPEPTLDEVEAELRTRGALLAPRTFDYLRYFGSVVALESAVAPPQ